MHCRAGKNAGRSNERRNMQKRHVTQKARCVRLVHGGHISRVLRGKTQGIVGPRARTQARTHAHVCMILWRRRGSWWRFQEWLMPGRRRRATGWQMASCWETIRLVSNETARDALTSRSFPLLVTSELLSRRYLSYFCETWIFYLTSHLKY